MKLNIGQNIRTLRRAKDMTQEELAEKLGVTFQTVSRWENGGTYPEMELLPAIAGVFGVTIDHLLGNDAQEREKQLKDIVKRFKNAVRNRENDTVIALLRELRRDMRQYTTFYNEFMWIWIALHWYGKEAPADVLEEVRLFFTEYRSFFTIVGEHHLAVRTMAIIEDEENIIDFLYLYCTSIEDFTAETMLLERYKKREETEKAEQAIEASRHRALSNLFFRKDKLMNEQNIAYLHALHGVTPDPEHPVSGDGSIDLWFDSRKDMGYRQAEYCLDRGDKDSAFVILEDIVSMLETLMKRMMENTFPDGRIQEFELGSTSPVMPTYKIFGSCALTTRNGKRYNEVRLRCNDLLRHQIIVSPRFELEFCDNIYKWRIGDDPRYEKLRERLTALIISPDDN